MLITQTYANFFDTQKYRVHIIYVRCCRLSARNFSDKGIFSNDIEVKIDNAAEKANQGG